MIKNMTNKTMFKGQSKEKRTEKHKKKLLKKEQNEIKERDSQNVFQCTNQDVID